MRRIVILVGAVALFVGAGRVGWREWNRDTPPPVEWSADMQAVAGGNNRFALDLYAKLRQDEQGNILFSPYSAHTALAMTAVGARGRTRDQMVKALHLPPEEDRQLAAGDLGRFYGHPRKDYELAVANAIWGQKGTAWRPEFRDGQKTRFGSEFREADFAGDPDGERDRINRWVGAQTRERIQELLQQGNVSRQTTMVLVNAVYFKAPWVTEFDPKKTRSDTFHCADDTRVQVPMMHAEMRCGYAERDGVRIVELPYKGGELAMVIVLPKLPGGLPAVERGLTAEALASWRTELQRPIRLGVTIPKFRIESRFELNKPLAALGMTDAFAAADFSGMSPSPPGRIAHVVQKAFIDVNEEGTEAAAATAVVGVLSSGTLPFHVDHPFLFLIRDTKRGTILFMGRVEKP